MFHRLALLFAVLIMANTALAETVRVRLKKSQTKVQLTAFGLEIGGHSPSPIERVAVPRLQTLEVSVEKKGLSWLWRLKDKDKGEVLRLLGPDLSLTGEMMRIGLEPTPHKIHLIAGEDQGFDIISEMDLETYLAGVLPSEMPSSWPLEALKAQAVAVRSYALNTIRERRGENFHLEASVYDQVYRMLSDIEASPINRERARRALQETRGEVLKDDRGRVLRAYYHSDCGGQTENAQLVWGAGPPTPTTIDAQCPRSPRAQWALSLTRREVRELLGHHLGIEPTRKFKGLTVAGRTNSGRVQSVDILFEGLTPIRLASNQFREVIGFSRLKSTNFDFRWFGDTLVFDGRGHGHGVGLCQWGTRELALNGKSYREILNHYYPGTRLSCHEGLCVSRQIASAATSTEDFQRR